MRYYLFVIFIFFTCNASWAQGLRQDFSLRHTSSFGELNKLVGEHYEIIYSKHNLQLAKEVLKLANANTTSIENILGYRLSGKIEIRLFENPLAFELTKNKLSSEIVLSQNTGGNTEIVQNDFDLVFDGNRAALKAQIRGGIANALLLEMLYGGTVQEKIKYASLMQLPHWFIKGLVDYIATPWDAIDDDNLRDLIFTKEKFQINDLSAEQQTLIGKNLWMYIKLLKGEGSFQRILYLVRLTRKIENATYFVFNWNTSELIREWHHFVLGSYSNDQKRNIPQQSEKLINHNLAITAILKSGSKYFINQMNKEKVCLYSYDLSSKTTQIVKTSQHLKNSILPPIYCSDGVGGIFELTYFDQSYKLNQFNGKTWEKVNFTPKLDYIKSLNYNSKTRTFLISGLIESDNVLMSCKENEKGQVIFMSEMHLVNPIWHETGESVLFAALVNNSKTSDFNYDVFELFLKVNNGLTLLNRTNTKLENEISPTYYGILGISYLSDKNGIVNSYLRINSDSAVKNLTDYQRNIHLVYYDMPNAEVIEVLKMNGRFNWFVSTIDTSKDVEYIHNPIFTYFKEKSFVVKEIESERDTFQKAIDTTDIGIYFQTDFPEEVDFKDTNLDSIGSKKIVDGFEPFNIYNPTYLKPRLLITQLDNGVFNTYYLPSFNTVNEVVMIPIGLNVALKYREVANKYNFTLGTRIARNFNQFGYFLRLDAYKSKVPYQAEVFRQSKRLFRTNDSYNKVISTQLALSAFVYTKNTWNVSVGWTNRNDVHNYLSTSEISLKQKNIHRNYTGPKFEAIFNNAKEVNTNSYLGSKFKFYAQGFINTTQKGNLMYFGADFRNGKDLHNNFYWMNRVQFEVSAGSEKVTYLAGGVENWLYPELTSENVLKKSEGYYRMVASIRGFGLNHRNGNSFAVINSEIRYKPIGSLFYTNSRSALLNNFLFVGFTDLAAVWYGISPYAIKSPLNTSFISTGALDIVVYNRKQPILFGAGFGIRTSIFGYYFKFDQAWGYDNGVWGKPYQYLTLGKDF